MSDYRPNPDAGRTELVPGLEVWNEVEVDRPDYEGFDVRATVRLTDGRLGIDQLTVTRRENGESVTGKALRSIVVQNLIRASLMTSRDTDSFDPVMVRSPYGLLRTDDVNRMREAGPVTETLEAVAKVYTAALAVGDPPTKAVQATFDVPRPTIDRWVAKARDRGILDA